MIPGATALTCTPLAANSSARPLTAWFRPPLTSTGSNAGTRVSGCSAMEAVMAMICPCPCSAMIRAAA
ncbi:hypothetical protein D3C79_1000200 [compost metagenome]